MPRPRYAGELAAIQLRAAATVRLYRCQSRTYEETAGARDLGRLTNCARSLGRAASLPVDTMGEALASSRTGGGLARSARGRLSRRKQAFKETGGSIVVVFC